MKQTALMIFIIAAVVALPAFLTGEGAEESIEKIPGFEKTLTETHEEWGLIFVWTIGGLGLLSVITLLSDFMHWAPLKFLYLITLMAGIVTIFIAYKTSNTGGVIRHSEIRSENTPATLSVPGTIENPNSGNDGKKDDDD